MGREPAPEEIALEMDLRSTG
ncbi:hypothetical protein [Streptosporangium longisporum]